MDSLSIRKIIDKISSGEIRIPSFQRGFVWEPDAVAFFMDSLYKGYPIGAILLWRTREKLVNERNLGRFILPDPVKDYPIDYVLDGQQRLTSIFLYSKPILFLKMTPIGVIYTILLEVTKILRISNSCPLINLKLTCQNIFLFPHYLIL